MNETRKTYYADSFSLVMDRTLKVFRLLNNSIGHSKRSSEDPIEGDLVNE